GQTPSRAPCNASPRPGFERATAPRLCPCPSRACALPPRFLPPTDPSTRLVLMALPWRRNSSSKTHPHRAIWLFASFHSFDFRNFSTFYVLRFTVHVLRRQNEVAAD